MSLDHCTVCRERTATACSICLSARYCSPVCQEKDILFHIIVCSDFAFIINTPRPSETCYLAYYFPVDGVAPQVIRYEDGQMYQKKDSGEVTSSHVFEHNATGSIEFSTSYPLDLRIHSTKVPGDIKLEIQLPQNSKGEAKNLNMALLHTTQGQQRDLWAGSIVVCALYDGKKGIRRNVTMEDWSLLLSFLRETGNGNDRFGNAARTGRLRKVEVHYPVLFRTILEQRSTGCVKGVEISRAGFDGNKFTAVDIPDAHPIFHKSRTNIAVSSTRSSAARPRHISRTQ